MMPAVQPEIDVLLACARTPLDAVHAERLHQQLQGQLDWGKIIRLAGQHAVLPLLHHHLKAVADPQAIPQAAWRNLQHLFRKRLNRNLAMTAELLRQLRLLEAHGIPVIPYKGPALAAAVYGDVALRQFGDLDILVKPRDVLKVKDLLMNQGYQPEFDMTPVQEAAYLRSSCEYNFTNKVKGIHLEVHWRIARPYFMFPLDIDQLWDHLETVQLGGHRIPSLGVEDLLLILCVHGGKHQWDRLGWICDIAQLLHHRPELQWELLIAQATRLGVIRFLRLGLLLAHDLLDAVLPSDIEPWVQSDRMVKTLAAVVCEQLFQGKPHSSNNLAYHLFCLKMRERWRDRIAYSCRLSLALTVEELLLLPLPSYLSGFYYCLRPVRLIGKYAELLFRR